MSLTQLLTTVESREEAMALGYSAVDARLAACVQIMGPITSVYRWQGTVEENEEFLCLLKTTQERLEDLVTFIREGHPYETPEITVVESLFTEERYLAWAQQETQGLGGTDR